jgi:outer membrane biosynthesis protein TonB
MNSRLPRRLVLPSLTLAAAAVITACGGGGSDSTSSPAVAPSGVAQAAIVEGPVTGFGSVVVNGVRFDESNAVIVDDDGQQRSRAELRIGSMVRVEGLADDSAGTGSATKVVLMPSLLGTIEAVDASAGTMVVLGQTVKVDGGTTFDGTTGLAALVAGEVVRIHGLLAADGTFAATLIERLSGPATYFELRGIVRSVDTTARRMTVGSLTIDYSSASIKPTGATPAVGDVVRIESDAAPVAGVLAARKIKIRSPKAEYAATNGYVEIKGILDAAPDASGKTTVSGVPVVLAGAKLEGNGNLVAGQRVEVKGVEVDGVIQASRVEFEGSRAGKVGGSNELYGVIDGFMPPARFTVNGVTVDASQASFSNGAINNLADGRYVEVKGEMRTDGSGTVLVARKVEFKAKPKQDDDKDASKREYYGAIQDFVSIASFTVNGMPVDASGAKIEDGKASALGNGVFVEVEGTLQGDKLIASELEFKGPRGGTTTTPPPTPTPPPPPTPTPPPPPTPTPPPPTPTPPPPPAPTPPPPPAPTPPPPPAPGPSAANGKVLYSTAPAGVSLSCATCHGAPPDGAARKGANAPSQISAAIAANRGNMGIYSGKYSAQQLSDLAAYLAGPTF